MIDYRYDEKTQRMVRVPSNKFDTALILLSEGKLTSEILLRIHRIILKWLRKLDQNMSGFFRTRIMNRMEVVPNRITFGVFQEFYADNCKYIAEKIRERGLDYEMIFIVKKNVYLNPWIYDIPPYIRLVRRNTMESFFALATSKFWFDNALICIWKKIPKKKEQIYINTWHGSLGIKKLSGNDNWISIAKDGDQMIDYFLTDSIFDEEVFSGSFWPNVKHLKLGHPRNDLMFDQEKMKEIRQKVYNHYNFPDHVHLALYGPTFRDNKSDVSAINVDYTMLKEALERRFGGEWYIMSRLHHHNAKSEKAKKNMQGLRFVKDVSGYKDMMELMAAAEVGITDYSSWIFDYLFTGRPGFIYAADIENYRNDRGFYYSLDETPFQIADTNELLSENIQAFDQEIFDRKVEAFLKARGCYEDGKACDRVVDFIVEHTN